MIKRLFAILKKLLFKGIGSTILSEQDNGNNDNPHAKRKKQTAHIPIYGEDAGREVVKCLACVDLEDADRLNFFRWNLLDERGYVVSYSTGKKVIMHRLILKARKGQNVTHIDGNPLNNTKANLLLITNQQKSWIRCKKKGPSVSQYIGVRYHKRDKIWFACIVHNYRQYCLGSYDTEIEAALAYDMAAIRIRGRFAQRNFKNHYNSENKDVTQIARRVKIAVDKIKINTQAS